MKNTQLLIEKNGGAGKKNSRQFFGLLLLLALTPLLMGGVCCSSEDTTSFFDPPPSQITLSPQGDRVFTQIHMLDETSGWALSDNSVLKTNDGGKSWIDVTPLDWEPNPATGTATPSDPSQLAIASISNATFLDANHAWIVASTPLSQNDINAQATAAATVITTNNAGTPTVNSKAIPPDTTTTYVRSTVDGGHTWVTSNPITLQNVLGTSQPDFINTHEGWLEVMKEDNKNNQTVGALYHSVNGGITWKLYYNFFPQDDASIDCTLLCNGPDLFQDLPLIQTVTDNGSLTGATILPDCIPQPSNTQQSQQQQCLPASTDQTLGCTVPGTQDYVATATGTFSGEKSTPVYLNVQAGAHADWHILFPVAIPGGAAQQSDKSIILSEPPVLFSSGSAILPIEIDNAPDQDSLPSNSTSTSAHSYLHLYGIALKGAGKGYTLVNLSPTSQFTVAEISGRHTLSATDPNHVFVLGQAPSSSNDDADNWNLYEFNGGKWTTLTTQTDATIPAPQGTQQVNSFSSELANLDMISPTEGWASSKTQLYHLSISGTTATWSLVYPSESLATATAQKIISPHHDPGSVIPAPQNPPACSSPPPPPNNGGNGNGSSNSVNHTISFVNNTNQTIWVGESGQAASTTRPDGNWNGELGPGQTGKLTVTTPGAVMENMRFWGRTGCDSGGANCETADCGVGGLCNGNGGQPPASLAEFTYNGGNGLVYYDISLVDGYNLPTFIQSSGGSPTDTCGSQGCIDLNSVCPGVLQIKNASGQVVACDSNCTYAQSHKATVSTNDLNEYCCLGQYVEGVCNPNNPAVWSDDLPNWSKLAKSAYPKDYSYPDDDLTSTDTCSETCDYTVTFGLSASSARQGGFTNPPGGDITTRAHRSSTRS